jgi:hypothetical protein
VQRVKTRIWKERLVSDPWADAEQLGRAVVVAGYGKLPQGTSVEQLHKILALVVLIDPATAIVLDASSTLLTSVGDRFVTHHLRGLNLRDDPARFVDTVTRQYQGNAQKAIIAAFRDLVRRYMELHEASSH